MEKDITPELLSAIEKEIEDRIAKSKVIQEAKKLLFDNKSSYNTASDLAGEVGDIIAAVFKEKLSSDVLPNGKMYYNIADKILNKIMGDAYKDIANYAAAVQTQLNKNVGIGLKGIKPGAEQDRIDGIIKKVSHADSYDDVAYMLNEPVVNYCMSVVDRTVKANSEFQAKAGIKAVIKRISTGHCCEWCNAIAGTYEYPDVPKDVYRRHRFCRCMVEYNPGNGKRQNVHTKKWIDLDKKGKINIRCSISSKTDFRKNDYSLIDETRNNLIPNENTEKIIQGRQNKHRKGSNEYKTLQATLNKKGEFGPSTVTISDNDILELVDKYKGSGELRISNGKWMRVETILDNDVIIGEAVNNLNGKAVETDVFKIHYGDDGVHISPDYPSKKRRKK